MSHINQFIHFLHNSFSWAIFFFTTHLIFAGLCSFHAMLIKRDPRAALGWMSVCVLFPLVGPILYIMLGINRVKTKARAMAGRTVESNLFSFERGDVIVKKKTPVNMIPGEYWRYAKVAEAIEERSLLADNKISILINGEHAYREMLASINTAKQYIYLCSYIFETDEIGSLFIKALSRARKRGVVVNVSIDGIGELYSRPTASHLLKQSGVIVAKFNPPSLIPPSINLNLRNHKKILVVDGIVGFTGGMNISARNIIKRTQHYSSSDLHFKVEGPVVSQLAEVFHDDWLFITNEDIKTPISPNIKRGSTFCRCIADGPSEDLDKLLFIINGLISTAKQQITIITPYFLPNREMISSLQSASIRGVDVKIILPCKSNIRIIDWATQNMLWELLQCGVNVLYQPEPFAHTKLILVDELYAHVGSANLDPRSLRLNFELNLEIFDRETTAALSMYAKKVIERSRKITLTEIDKRCLMKRTRDAFFWLFMHYL